MADQNTIEVKIGANVEGARRGAKEATDAVDGILDKLKDFKRETVQTGREARFFALELASIIPGASGAAGAVKELLAVALSGSAIGIAVESVKLLAGVFREIRDETKKVNAEIEKASTEWVVHIKAVHDETEKLRLSLRGISATELAAYAELEPLREQRRKQQAALSKAEGELGEAEVRASKIKGTAESNTLVLKTAVTAAAHKAIAAAREDLRVTNEKIEGLEKEYALRRKVESKSPLEASIAEAQQRADQASIESAINLARIQTEQEVRTAREMGTVRLNADEKMKLAQEVADAQQRADQQTEESAINLGRIETQQRALTKAQHKEMMAEFHAMAATAKEVGDAIGNALVGMAGDSMTAAKAVVEMLKMIIKSVIEMAIKMVIARAATAAAGAAESQAAIPVAGPWLAIGALAMVEGAVLALLSMIPGAATGADIPRGVNPIMQLHGGESVITRRTTDRLQDFLDGQGGGSAGGDVHVHLHGTLIDGAGVERFFRSYEARRAMKMLRSLGES